MTSRPWRRRSLEVGHAPSVGAAARPEPVRAMLSPWRSGCSGRPGRPARARGPPRERRPRRDRRLARRAARRGGRRRAPRAVGRPGRHAAAGTNADAADAPDLVIVATTWEAAVATAARARRRARRQGRRLDGERPREGRTTSSAPVLPPHGSLAAGGPGRRARRAGRRRVPARPRGRVRRPRPARCESDVVVCGDDDDGRGRGARRSSRACPSLRAFDGGSLANAVGHRDVRRGAAHGEPPPQGQGDAPAHSGVDGPPGDR